MTPAGVTMGVTSRTGVIFAIFANYRLIKSQLEKTLNVIIGKNQWTAIKTKEQPHTLLHFSGDNESVK